jgi:hypothetical protein
MFDDTKERVKQTSYEEQECNGQQKKTKMIAGVLRLTPLSTIFHLYFGGHTINGRQTNALYYSYFSH